MGLAPRSPVAAPLALPPRLGLIPSLQNLSEANPDASLDERWTAGYRFFPENCGTSGVGNPCGDVAKDIPPNNAEVEAEPFYVWAGDKCSPFAVRDFVGRAERQLAASESYQIARELWRGDLAQTETTPEGDPWPNQYLSAPAADTITAAAVSVPDGIALLEQALGDCLHGQRGAIHVTRSVLTLMANERLVVRQGNLLLTTLDTLVICDAGYDGSGPNGTPAVPGHVYAYGTAIPLLRMQPNYQLVPDPGAMAMALDRATNLVEWRIERLASVTWAGCCSLAAELNAPVPLEGGAS